MPERNMKGSCLCFGIPLDRATLYVAISDVLIGISSFTLFAIHLKMIHDGTDDDFCCNVFNFLFRRRIHKNRHYYNDDENNLRVPPWLPVVLLVCSVIQCIMGFVLAVATAKRSRKICRFWLFITGITCVFTFFLLRIYQMLVVSEYCHELGNQRFRNSFQRNTQNFNAVQQHQQTNHHNHSAQNSHSQISMTIMNTSSPSSFPGSANFSSANSHFQHHHVHPLIYAPPTPPSYVPTKDEEDPPPSYYEAIATKAAAKRY